VSFVSGDEPYRLSARREGDGWRVALGDRDLDVKVAGAGPAELVLAFGERRERFRIAREGLSGDLLVAWRGGAYRLARPAPLSADAAVRSGGHDGASLAAPMPGTLVRLLVREGDAVQEGQPLAVLEAMKMEHTVVAPYSGTVRRLPFAQGASVAGGAPLVDLLADDQG
jgi:3-methylcrotonyl-CoA carboxylase alpha subunit